MAKRGTDYVLEYERRHGREPKDVSRNRKFIGFDVLSVDSKAEDHRTIEVKSTSRGGIPDAFQNEFTRDLKFVATHLYLVWFEKDKETVKNLQIIPKKVIDRFSDQHREVGHVKFASKLQSKVKSVSFPAD